MRSAISPRLATSSFAIAIGPKPMLAAMEPVRWGMLSTARINAP